MSSTSSSARSKTGIVVWITGLPSSGKSKFAENLRERLVARGAQPLILDGDEVRAQLVPPPGYSDEERRRFYETLGNLAALLARQGSIVLVPATAHRRAYREHARSVAPRFFEVWVDVPLEQCRQRDKKGLYAKFAEGAVEHVPGEDAVYEAPQAPDVIATGGKDEVALAAVATKLVAWIQ